MSDHIALHIPHYLLEAFRNCSFYVTTGEECDLTNEEAYHRMETQQNGRDWDTSQQRVAALGLTLLREDGVSMELNALCIHEAKASLYLSKELLMRH